LELLLCQVPSLLQGLLLLLLLLWLAVRVLAATLQQLLHVGGSIHPVVPNHESSMQQLPGQHPQRPREVLISSTAVCCPPCRLRVRGRRQTPFQWVSCVIHCWGRDVLQILLLSQGCPG
jgi:hypothetical protein